MCISCPGEDLDEMTWRRWGICCCDDEDETRAVHWVATTLCWWACSWTCWADYCESIVGEESVLGLLKVLSSKREIIGCGCRESVWSEWIGLYRGFAIMKKIWIVQKYDKGVKCEDFT